MWIGILFLSGAMASDMDFAEEAGRRMKLSFDLDAVEARLTEPAAADLAGFDPSQPYYAQLAAALPLEPNSEVDSVTVLRDRALITRVLEVEADGTGDVSVVFTGLPLGLQAQSLHGRIDSGAARIVGVELVSGKGEVPEDERTEEIRESMLEITGKLGVVRDQIESLLAQRAYLRSTLLASRPEGQPQPGIGQVRGTLDFIGEAEREIAQQLREQELAAKDLDEELSPLLIKLDNPLATGMTVRVDLEVDASDPLEVALRYEVFGANWAPSYNARLDEESGNVQLEYYGIVTQQTGEDWDNALLHLSTANPLGSGGLPVLQPWFLGQSGYSVNIEGGGGHYDPTTAQLEVPTGGVVESNMRASVQGSGAVIFSIPDRRTVAGDGSAQRLPVGTQTFAAEMDLTAVPKVIPEVFRQARIRYEGDIPLLPGTVSTYAGADYVGTAQTASVVPGEVLVLAFGTDDRLKVSRVLLSRQLEQLGPGKRTLRYTFKIRISVSNFSGANRFVDLRDQVPVSELEKVTVKVLEVSEGHTTDIEQPGILQWRLQIPDGQERQVDIAFSVTAPRDVARAALQTMDLMY